MAGKSIALIGHTAAHGAHAMAVHITVATAVSYLCSGWHLSVLKINIVVQDT